MGQFPLEFHPAAVAEARAARKWYAERSPAAADAFVSELDNAIFQITEHPTRWAGQLHGTRQYVLRRFPFVVVYRTSNLKIEVVAIAHVRRRPGYWKNRNDS